MAEESDNKAEITTPLGSVKFGGKKTAEFIAILSLCLLFVLAWVVWEHKADAKEHQETLVTVMKDMVTAQREQNCLIAIKQDEREGKVEFCRRISR